MNDPVLQEIKDRLNIAEVISGYIQIKKAGVNFKAVCPFHSEKSPSLVISPQKQIWHCFGCGEGGDVFGFVMRYENMEFRDALKILADKAGVKLPEYKPSDPKIQDERELLLRINNFAARFYHEILTSANQSNEARDYLKKRGLSPQTIERWQIGYAPDDFHVLEKALQKKKVNILDMVKAGVSAKNERGQFYDRFRGRITFPIFNFTGEVVGFSARILKDNSKLAHSAGSTGSRWPGGGQSRATSSGPPAKYVNSPETPVYNKSKILFGLNFAKNEIRKKDEAVLVEGQMDCITAHQAGFANVIATSGTALTEQQLVLLSRLTKNLKFCFDSDSAGQEASRRAGELALKAGFRLKVITLTAAKDPDELISKSPGLWEKAVAGAVWFLDYQMDLAQKKSPQDPLDQVHYVSRQIVPFLTYISDPLEQDHYIRKLSERFGISEKVVREQTKPQSSLRFQKGAVSEPSKNSNFAMEKEIFGAALLYEDFRDKLVSTASPEDFESLNIKEQLLPIFQSPRGKADNTSTLAREVMFMVESQLDELDGNESVLKRQLEKSLALFKVLALKRQQLSLQREISEAQKNGNKNKLSELNEQFARIAKSRMEFEKLT